MTQNTTTIKLEATQALLDAAKQMANMGVSSSTKAPSAVGSGKGAPVATGKGQDSLQDTAEKIQLGIEGTKGYMSRLGKTLGIQVGLSSILKQSQIFTGTVGSIFQIMGALVDVILAPFLPIIVPAIRMLANMVPAIYAITSRVGKWIEDNLTVEKVDAVVDSMIGRVFAFFETFLPAWMTDPLKKSLQDMNWGEILKKMAFGAVMLVLLRKFGLFKLLSPIAKILGRIPFIGPLFKTLGKTLGGLGAKLAAALIPGFGKIFAKNTAANAANATKAAKMAKSPALMSAQEKVAAKAAGKRGMFGRMGAAMKGAGVKGIAKGVLKKAISGLGAAMLAVQGITGAIDVYKANRKADGSVWGSLGKAAVVGGTAAAFAGASFIPGAGLVAPIAGGFAVDYAKNKMMQSITVNVDGEEKMRSVVGDNEMETARTSEQDMVTVALGRRE